MLAYSTHALRAVFTKVWLVSLHSEIFHQSNCAAVVNCFEKKFIVLEHAKL